MRPARHRIRPLLYMMIGILVGLGSGFILFWGFPAAEATISPSPVIETGSPAFGEGTETGQASAQFGMKVGAPAPDFVLEAVNGEEYRLSDLRGNVVLLNFWATWCGPCLVEMPLLEAAYQDHKDDGFLILAVNDGESVQEVRAFGEENGLSIPLLLDPGRIVQRLYEIRGYPSSVLIDEQGQIRFIHIGLVQERQLNDYLNELGIGL
ncbi:MAG: redoxin domain-containing protein [Anaerolineales bacterium]|nr:redoxin domain-containing protein [Anaerolineales bacterium]